MTGNINPLTITTKPPIRPATVGQEYQFCFSATPPASPANPYLWDISIVNPAQFPIPFYPFTNSFFSYSGCIDGIAQTAGNFPFSVTVSEPGTGNVSPPAYFTLHVTPTTPAKAAYAKEANIEFYQCMSDAGASRQINGGTGAIVAIIQLALDCASGRVDTKSAADPPDSNFTTIAQPIPFPFVFPNTGWPANVSSSLNNLFTDQSQIFGLAQAALTATERSQGAQAAGNTYWYTRQSQAAAQFNELMRQRMLAYPSLATNFKTAYFGAGLSDIVSTPDEIKAVAAALPTLPSVLVNALIGAGFSSEDIAQVAHMLAVQAIPTTNVSLFTLQEQKASAFSTTAPNFSPVAALRTAITNPYITLAIRVSLGAELNEAEAAIGQGNFKAACGVLTALGLEANAQRGIGIPPAQDDAINVALAATSPFCPAQ